MLGLARSQGYCWEDKAGREKTLPGPEFVAGPLSLQSEGMTVKTTDHTLSLLR